MSKLFDVCQFADNMTKSDRQISTKKNESTQQSAKELLVNPAKYSEYKYVLLSLSENTSPLHMTRVRPVWDNLCKERGGCPFSHYKQHCNLQLQSTSTILNQWLADTCCFFGTCTPQVKNIKMLIAENCACHHVIKLHQIYKELRERLYFQSH